MKEIIKIIENEIETAEEIIDEASKANDTKKLMYFMGKINTLIKIKKEIEKNENFNN